MTTSDINIYQSCIDMFSIRIDSFFIKCMCPVQDEQTTTKLT